MMLMLTLITGHALADTPAYCEGVTMETFEAADETAALMLMDMDFESLAALQGVILRDLTCLSEPISGSAAASVYGMIAMSALVDPQRGEPQVRAALYAAGLASAGYTLPDAIPSTHKLRTMQGEAADYASAMDNMSAPEGSVLVVDGVASRTRRIGAPAIVQITTGGKVTSTIYLAPAVAWSDRGDDAQQ